MHSSNSSPHNKPTSLSSKTLAVCCLIFAGLLQGCGATLPVCPDVSSVQAKQPSVSTPAPAQPYSKQWQQAVEDWQKLVQESRQKLMGTQLMSD